MIYLGNIDKLNFKLGSIAVDKLCLGDNVIWENKVLPLVTNFTADVGQVIQTYVAPYDGLYKLEVWGCSGVSGDNKGPGGVGGYSVGYKVLDKDDVLYIVCGRQDGFGGGGTQGRSDGLSAGGATHIAKVTGQIADIGYESFVTNGNGLIVAGGGGGGTNGATANRPGGAGGGLEGGYAEGAGDPGTQTTGFGFGTGAPASGTGGLYGKASAGGGGLYGGNIKTLLVTGGGGGSGYIGGVPTISFKGQTYSPSTVAGGAVPNELGKATITLLDYQLDAPMLDKFTLDTSATTFTMIREEV